MGRKQELTNFLNYNEELLDKSKKRLFVDLYATGNYYLKVYDPQINPKDVSKGVLEQLLVMQRKNPSSSNSEFVHILPIIDINSNSQQITSNELKQMVFSTKSFSSILPIPHSYHDYLSGEFWENEKNCITNTICKEKRNTTPVVYTKRHMKLLSQLYGYEKMPFLKQSGNKNRIEFVKIQSARNTIFSSLFKSAQDLSELIAMGLEDDLALPNSLQEYRALREVVSSNPIRVFDTSTQKISLEERDVFYERPFDARSLIGDNSKSYLQRKHEAAEYISSLNAKQGSLF